MTPKRVWRRLRALLRKGDLELELDEELRYHLDRLIEQNVADGMSREEARAAALRAFDGLEQARESCRDARRVRPVEEFVRDLGHGIRALARNRGLAAAAVLTLGLGIGANTAVFSVIDAVFLRPLPYGDPGRLVMVWEDDTAHGYPRDTPPPGNYVDWREHNTVFEDMAATAPVDLNLTGDGEPERLQVLLVTANFLPVLGVEPERGRAFLPDEDREGAPNVIILGHGLWQRRYAGAADVIGREILLDGERFTVVGVMPPGFQFLDDSSQALVPFTIGPKQRENRGTHFLRVVARLKPGVTVAQAQAEMQTTMERIGAEYPDEAGVGAAVVPLHEQLTGDVRQSMVVLVAAVALVLLIACVNVGNLMLSRAAARRREIAVRVALGAGRGRIARQLLVENVPLALLGTGVGLVCAYGSLGLLERLIPRGLRASAELGLDARVFAFAVLVGAGTVILFGLVPALQGSKVDLHEAMRRGGARAGFSGGRLRSALVVAEVSLAIALLVSAGLLIRTFVVLRGQYSDLQAASVITMKTMLSSTAYDTHAKRDAFFERVLERIGSLPGVVSAAYTNALPLDTKGEANNVAVEGRAAEPGDKLIANIRLVSPDYLEALGVPLRRGRQLSDADGPDGQPVAVVNETMARQFWPGEDALGKRFKMGGPKSDAPWVTVVGVATDVRQTRVDAPVKAETYLPYRQCDYMEIFAPKAFVVRASGDQAGVVAAARREIAAVDPNQPVSDVKTMSDILSDETSTRGLGTLLLGAFAAVALLLASVGIYGLLAQVVEQKRPEIGVRLALGATPARIVGAVVGRGMKLVLLGSAVGLALSFGLTRLMQSLLFGVGAGDPLTLAGVPALLALVALAACYVPARRAARVDPSVTLRSE